MITAFNTTNSEQYKLDLFARAQQALRDHYNAAVEKPINYDDTVTITTLNDYFCYIKDLNEIDPKFTVLPLDEETFNIDANTRVINIPVAFKKNGLGVQGDNYAETIYFLVDRYFDNMDLAAPDMQIQIQYEVYDDKGRPVKKDIPAIIKDTEKIQNKLLFGWQINNDVTERAGNVRFSVRFYKTEGTETVYSLSTLTATIGINQALDFDVQDFSHEDPTDALKRRLTNSVADGATIATFPLFIVDLPFEKGVEQVDLHDADELNEAAEDKEEYTFTALAHSNDEGIITYDWYKDNELVAENPERIKILTKDTQYNAGKAYWYKDGEEFKYWVPGSTEFTGQELYEERAVFTVDGVGIYKVRANNTIKTSTKFTDSKVIEVPGPKVPMNVLGINQKALADFDNNEKAEITITAEKGAPGDAEVTYKWYKVNNTPNEAEPEGFTPTEEDEILGTEDTLEVTAPGWYTAIIVGNRNKATVEFESNKFYRVTYKPETEFEFAFDPYEEEIAIDEYATVDVGTPNNRQRYDELLYQWYLTNADGTITGEAIEGYTTNLFEPVGNFAGQYVKCGVKAIYNDMIGEEQFSTPIRITVEGDNNPERTPEE